MVCSKKKLLVCVRGKRCHGLDSKAIFAGLKEAIATENLDDHLKVKKADCFGLCQFGPVIRVEPEGVSYGRLDREDLVRIALRHARKKKPLKKLLVGKKKARG